MTDNNIEKTPAQIIAERQAQRRKERNEWHESQRASFYDRQAIFNKKPLDDEFPTRKDEKFTNWALQGQLERDKDSNNSKIESLEQSNKIIKEFLTKQEEKEKKERIRNEQLNKEIEKNHVQSIKKQKMKNQIHKNNEEIEELSNENNKIDKALELLNARSGKLTGLSKEAAKLASFLVVTDSDKRGVHKLIERREQANSVAHIEDTEKRIDALYRTKFNNMHLDNGHAGNKLIKNLRPGEKPNEPYLVELPFISPKQQAPLLMDILRVEPLSEKLKNSKSPLGIGVVMPDEESRKVVEQFNKEMKNPNRFMPQQEVIDEPLDNDSFHELMRKVNADYTETSPTHTPKIKPK